MSLNPDDLNNHNPVGFNKTIELIELEKFERIIEKTFFSIVTTRCYMISPLEAHLVVELNCNFNLIESLNHFKKGLWGSFSIKNESLVEALKQLKKSNNININLEEFSIFFNDTAIIINRFYEQSISDELENIFNELTSHYIHYTKGLKEIPYEIYLPVFEENVLNKQDILPTDLEFSTCCQQDYFSFWGLYYDSEDEAVIYDLKNQTVINGNLQMLNR